MTEKMKNSTAAGETQVVRIRYFSDDTERLRFIDGKSDWIDLRAACDVTMHKGEYALIPLGVAMQLPAGYEAIVAPRSSTYKNFHITQTNSIAVIDESYCGTNDQWYFPALAHRDTTIHKGDRICQFRLFRHQPPVRFVESDTLDSADRGGIGSTGVR